MYRLGDHLKEGGFFGAPCLLVESERYVKLPITARLVARDLYCIVHRVSSPRFHAKESALEKLLNLDRKTLRSALVAIEGAGLLQLIRGARGEPSEFWLRNPITGLLLPEQEGRATPTFNGAPKGKRTRLEAIAKEPQTLNQSQTQLMRLEPTLPMGAMPESRSEVSIATSEPQQIPAHPDRICSVHGNVLVHYRTDGSPLCGVCHPTGITAPICDPGFRALSPCKPFNPPTAKEIGFD